MEYKLRPILGGLLAIFWLAWLGLSAGLVLERIKASLFASLVWAVLLLLGLLLLAQFLPKKVEHDE
jgi:DMSO/TMAO reductase YedYZ heme-binding membrane subunit